MSECKNCDQLRAELEIAKNTLTSDEAANVVLVTMKERDKLWDENKNLEQQLKSTIEAFCKVKLDMSQLTKGIERESLLVENESLRADLKNAGDQYRRANNLEEKLKLAVSALKFYATYSPRQHPEGYYEIHVAPGEGGEVRFGTLAKEALAKLQNSGGG